MTGPSDWRSNIYHMADMLQMGYMLEYWDTRGEAIRNGQVVSTVMAAEPPGYPPTVRFTDPIDAAFRDELWALRRAAASPSGRWRIRALGGMFVAFNVELDDGRSFTARVGPPHIWIGPGSQVRFPLEILRMATATRA